MEDQGNRTAILGAQRVGNQGNGDKVWCKTPLPCDENLKQPFGCRRKRERYVS